MRPHDKDIFGDGHGFVNVSQGGPPSGGRKRVVEVQARGAFSQDLRKLDDLAREMKPFLGLYVANGQKEVYIIWRAHRPDSGFRFLTCDGSQHPHYITDPVAWAGMPDHSHIKV